MLSASLIYAHQFWARRPRVRSVVENFNGLLSILDHSFPAICLKRYIAAAINLNRFLLEREREIERYSFPLIFLMMIRTIGKNKKKIANNNPWKKILIEKSHIALPAGFSNQHSISLHS